MGITLARVYDSANTVCVKTFVTLECLPAANVLRADVFGTDIFP